MTVLSFTTRVDSVGGMRSDLCQWADVCGPFVETDNLWLTVNIAPHMSKTHAVGRQLDHWFLFSHISLHTVGPWSARTYCRTFRMSHPRRHSLMGNLCQISWHVGAASSVERHMIRLANIRAVQCYWHHTQYIMQFSMLLFYIYSIHSTNFLSHSFACFFIHSLKSTGVILHDANV